VSASIETENECAHSVEVFPSPTDLCGIGEKKEVTFLCACARVQVCVHKKKKDKNRAALVVDGGRFGLHIGQYSNRSYSLATPH